MTSIPPSFLEGNAPNATLHPLDFQHTTPPIPAYKDHFAAIIDNFLTPTECIQLLNLAEKSTTDTNPDPDSVTPLWTRAMLNTGNNTQTLSTDTRNCSRIVWDTPIIATRLLTRLRPFLEQCGIDTVRNQPLVTGPGPVKRCEAYRVSGLNERLRFLRYEGGEFFRRHFDGNYVTGDGQERSLVTVHLYLNGDGVQDLEELEGRIGEVEKRGDGLFGEDDEGDEQELDVSFGESDSDSESESEAEADQEKKVESGRSGNEDTEEGSLLGGATSFTDGYESKDAVRVFPKAGSVLIFQQRNLVHGGDDVFRGVKYTMRTDVMYERVCDENE